MKKFKNKLKEDKHRIKEETNYPNIRKVINILNISTRGISIGIKFNQ